MPVESQTCKKPYTAPTLNKLTLEQANLLLIGRATCGNQGAKDLLEVIYPTFQSEGMDDVPADVESGESASITAQNAFTNSARPRGYGPYHRQFSSLGPRLEMSGDDHAF
jgi:hypothetical protein